MQENRSPQLYLIVPPDPHICEELRTHTRAGAVASVLIRSNDAEGFSRTGLKAAVAGLQAEGIAVLCDTVEGAKLLGADGVHVDLKGSEDLRALQDAIRTAPRGSIIGAGGLRSRHAAMSAAELQIDYVMFGEPDQNGQVPSREAVMERGEWWSRVFTVPCVVFATEISELGTFANIGADFLALELSRKNSSRDIQKILAASFSARGHASQ